MSSFFQFCFSYTCSSPHNSKIQIVQVEIQVLSVISCMAWSSYLAFLYFSSPTFKSQIKDHYILKVLY